MNSWDEELALLEFDRFVRRRCEEPSCSKIHRRRQIIYRYWVRRHDQLDVSNVVNQIVGTYRMTLRRSIRGRIYQRETVRP